MNQTEKRYACKRVEELTATMLFNAGVKFRQENYVPEKTLTTDEKLEMIRKGEVSLIPRKQIKTLHEHQKSYIERVYDFSKHEHKSFYKNQDDFLAKEKAAKAASQALIDEIMLGDAAKALNSIHSFERKLEELLS